MLVPGESDVAHLARLLGFQGEGEAPPLEDPIRVVVVVRLVKLPQIDVVGLHPSQAVFQALPGEFLVATRVLGHQEDLVATPLEGLAHELFGVTVVVRPSVVPEEGTVIHRGVRELQRRWLAIVHRRSTEVRAAHAQDGDLLAGAAEPAGGNAAALVILRYRQRRRSTEPGRGRDS